VVRSTGQIFQDDMGGFVLRMYSTTFLRLQEIGEGFDCCEPGSKVYYKAREQLLHLFRRLLEELYWKDNKFSFWCIM
jgi:hypothetical protein